MTPATLTVLVGENGTRETTVVEGNAQVAGARRLELRESVWDDLALVDHYRRSPSRCRPVCTM